MLNMRPRPWRGLQSEAASSTRHIRGRMIRSLTSLLLFRSAGT
jgi:hypothetical protein